MLSEFKVLLTIIALGAAAPISVSQEQSTLKETFKDTFLIGAAINQNQIYAKDAGEDSLIKAQFNSITPENVLKWESVHPKPGTYDFAAPDAYVAFGQKNHMYIVGHALVWHHQTPKWVFEDEKGNPLSRDALLQRMHDHIRTVVGRYKGRINSWDVVNEALEEDGSLRQSPWLKIIGEDYIAKAFEFAHEADPSAQLNYNEYALENPAKREGALKLIKKLIAEGVPVAGVGLQEHDNLDWPSVEQLDTTITELGKLGMKVMITELDMDVLPKATQSQAADVSLNVEAQAKLNPYKDGLPDSVQQALSRRYADLFAVFLKHRDVVTRVTFWGVADGGSWLNDWPVKGRTSHPLLFDRHAQPKPAFRAVINADSSASHWQQSNSTKTPQTFRNPIISGFHPDPSICRVGDDYYMVHSSFEFFPGVPIFHSKDLVHWQQIGYVLTRQSQLRLDQMRASGGIYAPTLRYRDGTFYMVTTLVGGGGNFYVTAKDPAGPWSDPIWLDSGGVDPSLFFDDDGTVYYTRHEGMGDGSIVQGALDLQSGKLQGPLKEIWRGTGGIWPEGPHLYKIHGKYFLMIAEGGTSYGHMVTIARSDSPWGPFVPNPHNPILTHRDRPEHPIQALGHADLVETPDGWWMVALGIRPQGGEFHHLGRETFLAPVTWSEDDWPVVNKIGAIELAMPAPRLPQQFWEQESPRDLFDEASLGLQWNYLRNPYEKDYSLVERPGYLRLKGSAITLNDQDSPAFVGRRQTDLKCRASTQLSFDARHEDEEAGLVLRGNEKNHFEIGVTRRGGKRQVFFRQVMDGKALTPVRFENAGSGDVILTVEAAPTTYEFFYQTLNGSRKQLGSALTRDLSSEKVGGFTGVYIGLYATGNGQTSLTPADFDWFEYVAAEP